jgi:hypothetical protein
LPRPDKSGLAMTRSGEFIHNDRMPDMNQATTRMPKIEQEIEIR